MRHRFGPAVVLTLLALGSPTAAQQEQETPEVKAVEFTSADGMALHADLYEPAGGGETKPAVVACHEEGRDRSVWWAAIRRRSG